MSLRESIFAAEQEKQVLHEAFVPTWGVTVFFKPLTLAERGKIRTGAMVMNSQSGEFELNPEMFDLVTVLLKTLDADGNPIFKLSDREFLESGASNEAIQYLSRVIHGGGKEVKETPKNS